MTICRGCIEDRNDDKEFIICGMTSVFQGDPSKRDAMSIIYGHYNDLSPNDIHKTRAPAANAPSASGQPGNDIAIRHMPRFVFILYFQ